MQQGNSLMFSDDVQKVVRGYEGGDMKEGIRRITMQLDERITQNVWDRRGASHVFTSKVSKLMLMAVSPAFCNRGRVRVNTSPS